MDTNESELTIPNAVEERLLVRLMERQPHHGSFINPDMAGLEAGLNDDENNRACDRLKKLGAFRLLSGMTFWEPKGREWAFAAKAKAEKRKRLKSIGILVFTTLFSGLLAGFVIVFAAHIFGWNN